MDPQRIRRCLRAYQAGELSEDEVLERLARLPFETTEEGTLDVHRALRTGVPEVVFSEGKKPEQVAELVSRLGRNHRTVMATRADAAAAAAVRERKPDAVYFEEARIVAVGDLGEAPAAAERRAARRRDGEPRDLLVVSAGTADRRVAAEAAVTAGLLGHSVDRLEDVGVAGLHRLLAHLELLRSARVIICTAGMEGTLPGVVAGLVAAPVIGVPVSVGYGTSFGGVTPLLTMLNSCAEGLAVVNVDNGFGAARIAHAILTAATNGGREL